MTQEQWKQVKAVVDGSWRGRLPVGFIVDSPWLPGWAGESILDYFASEQVWTDVNLKAIERFPDAVFLPGFWSEFGMCTEPSAFGAKCVWHAHDLPFAHPVLGYDADWSSLATPDPRTDGLAPFMLRRLVRARPRIEAVGHEIRFAVARGPLNIASFLLGTTEFLMGLKDKPEQAHALLKTVTAYLVDWLRLQREAVDTIDGIFLLDDIAGFMGDEDFVEFGKPYLTQAFAAFDAPVKFFHNDAHGLVCAPHLADIGVNLFNFSFEHSLAEMQTLTGNRVALLGNIPPRDVLAGGTPEQVEAAVHAALAGVTDRSRIMLSCGGGIPQQVATENLDAFLRAAAGYSV